MKLYTAGISPFAARVNIALDFKGLRAEAAPLPAAGLKCPEFLALNPMGKIPLLLLADGTAIPESETILDYRLLRQGATGSAPRQSAARADSSGSGLPEPVARAPVMRRSPHWPGLRPRAGARRGSIGRRRPRHQRRYAEGVMPVWRLNSSVKNAVSP
jgi:glutathione S-transferase